MLNEWNKGIQEQESLMELTELANLLQVFKWPQSALWHSQPLNEQLTDKLCGQLRKTL
jgi:hypothetical protein